MVMPTTQQTQKTIGLSLIAEVDHDTFWQLLKRTDRPMVLTVHSGLPKAHKYITQYNGYYFVTKSKAPLDFSQSAEVIATSKIHLTPEWPNL